MNKKSSVPHAWWGTELLLLGGFGGSKQRRECAKNPICEHPAGNQQCECQYRLGGNHRLGAVRKTERGEVLDVDDKNADHKQRCANASDDAKRQVTWAVAGEKRRCCHRKDM